LRAPRAIAPRPARGNVESTVMLLDRVRHGDASARDVLVTRYLPILQRWAHGRLPGDARGVADTDDLVQVTLIKALRHLDGFEPRGEGAFLAWLRHILFNTLRDELRRASRRPETEELSETLPDPAPVEREMGREWMECYERALATLPAEQQEAVMLRIEFGFDYPEIAEAMLKPSPNAVRMAIGRALLRLAEAMDEHA
jgi:RNA polymerase sigma factor (sigma-70 family)